MQGQDDQRNGAQRCMLSLYFCLALSVLAQLFRQTEAGGRNSEEREVFLSRQAALQFREFAEAQVRRLQGIGTGKKGQRHELIGVHGYDIKAAMHVIRLLNEGIDLMRSGTITLPRPEKELLITIRTGQYGSLERVLTLANTLFSQTGAGRSHERTAGKSGQSPSLKTGWRYLLELLDRLIPPLHPRCPCRIAG